MGHNDYLVPVLLQRCKRNNVYDFHISSEIGRTVTSDNCFLELVRVN